MPLYFGRAKSKLRAGYNWSEGSVIVQKEEKILGPLNPGLNIFPIFKKMFHRIFLKRESIYILSSDKMNSRTIHPEAINTGFFTRKYRVCCILINIFFSLLSG
jgi:hypothetical protein